MDDESYDDDLWEPLSPEFQRRLVETVSRALAERRWKLFCEKLLHEAFPDKFT